MKTGIDEQVNLVYPIQELNSCSLIQSGGDT